MEESLEAVQQLIKDSLKLVDEFNQELQAKNGDNMELDLLLEKIKGTAEFRSVREQKGEVE